MNALGLTLFETGLGACGAAWSARGLIGLQLAAAEPETTRALMRARFPDAPETLPPAPIRAALDEVAALLRGEAESLRDIQLDMTGVSAFERAVYEAVRAIPVGETRSYGDIAKEVGAPNGAQAVGRAMARNPFAPVVPCHRVVAADGGTGGFSAPGGVSAKLKLLALEQAHAAQGSLFDQMDGAG